MSIIPYILQPNNKHYSTQADTFPKFFGIFSKLHCWNIFLGKPFPKII